MNIHILLCLVINVKPLIIYKEGKEAARKSLQQTIKEDLLVLPSQNTYNKCELGPWNNISTDTLPHEEKYKKWREGCKKCGGELKNNGEMRLISAFVYSDHIAVVISLLGQKHMKRKVYCHYYDCNRQAIGTFESILFPMATVRCVRRIGAEHISLSLGALEPVEPIPIINRVREPQHEIGVCAGQIYGDQPRWKHLIEFIEHHRLIGVSFFYLVVFEADIATTRVIHDYQRLGLLDPTWVNLEFDTITWQFQQIQAADCFYRSRMHSKWTINIDFDERFIMKNPSSLSQFLQSLPSSVVGLSFQVAKIPVTNQNIPLNATYFETYRNMTRPIWENMKSIYQYEHSYNPFYHWAWRIDTGYRVLTLNSTVGYFRHYRSGVPKNGTIYEMNGINPMFGENLKSQITRRLKYLFDRKLIVCQSINPENFPSFIKHRRCLSQNDTIING